MRESAERTGRVSKNKYEDSKPGTNTAWAIYTSSFKESSSSGSGFRPNSAVDPKKHYQVGDDNQGTRPQVKVSKSQLKPEAPKKDKNQGLLFPKWFWACATPGKEADASSSQGPSLRSGVQKESAEPVKSKFKEMSFRSVKFLEAVKDDEKSGLIFKTVLIQEGLGNLRDAYWYSTDALESAVSIFEGKKIYADHPSASDDSDRPERSVKDILGHFENVAVETDEDGRSMLTANVVVLPEQSFDWARGLMKHSLEYAKKYPDKEFVGLSINASGDSEPIGIEEFIKQNDPPESTLPKLQKAMDDGIDTLNVVKVIENAVSIDLVTEPGAGGKILKLIEEAKMATKANKKEAANQKTIKDALKENEDEKKDGAKDDGDGGGGHDDEDQDKKLIKSMIKKHLGDKSDGSEEEMEMYKQAVAAYGEMGYENEACHEAAGHAMKLAKHMAAKQAEADKKDDGDADDKKEAGDDKQEASSEKETAMESEVISLKAQVAKLQESERKTILEKHLESLCSESKLPRKVTDAFKTHVKEHGITTVDKCDKLWKTFTESYKLAGGEAGGYVISTEKQVHEGNGVVSFADCKID